MNFKNMRKKLAVSPIIGTLLILGITTSSFSVAYYTFGSSSDDSTSSYIVDISASIDNNQVIITHCGGDSLSLDTELFLIVDENSSTFKIGDYLDNNSKEDGAWSMGEQIFYPLGYTVNPGVNITINGKIPKVPKPPKY